MTDQKLNIKREDSKEEFQKRIKRFVLNLIMLVDNLPNERTCRIIGDQLLRSGTSIGANYFEAKGASSRKDFVNYFSHSLKSANETKFWLETLIEAEKCDVPQTQWLLRETTELANIFASSVITLKGKRSF